MKYLFAALFAIFLAAWAIAVATVRPEAPPGITLLRWATDPNPARAQQCAAFAKLHPGMKAVVDAFDPAKLVIQTAIGVGPDVLDTSETLAQSMSEAGVLLDLTELAKENGFGPEKTYPAIRPALMIDGKQYRFPCNVNVQAVLYNKGIFDDHQLPYPQPDWTWEDFVRTAKAIRDTPSKSGKKHRPVANWSQLAFFEDLLASHGVRLYSADGRTCLLDSPEAIAAMQQYYDFIFTDGILPTATEAQAASSQGGWGSGGINMFASGDAAMLMIGRWFTVNLPNFPELQGQVADVRLPHLPGQPSRVVASARAAAASKFGHQQKAAISFMAYLATPEYSRLIAESGDALPPNPDLARTGQDLVTKAMPDPAFHQVFIDAIRDAVPLDTSPYMDGVIVDRWMLERINQVESKLVTPEEAMRSLAREINKTIQINETRSPQAETRP